VFYFCFFWFEVIVVVYAFPYEVSVPVACFGCVFCFESVACYEDLGVDVELGYVVDFGFVVVVCVFCSFVCVEVFEFEGCDGHAVYEDYEVWSSGEAFLVLVFDGVLVCCQKVVVCWVFKVDEFGDFCSFFLFFFCGYFYSVCEHVVEDFAFHYEIWVFDFVDFFPDFLCLCLCEPWV